MKRILSRVLVWALVVSCLNVQVYAMDKRDGIVYKNGERIELSQEDLQELEDSYQELEEIRRNKQENREKYVTHRTHDELNEEASTYAYDILGEIETNDTRSTADTVREGVDMEGTISEEDDIDYFKIKYNDYGLAEVRLSSIPSQCDYDLKIFNESLDGIATSYNSDNEPEHLYFYVVPDEWYYFRVTSAVSADDTDTYKLRVYELVTDYRANLYGARQSDIDTEGDVTAGEQYFGTEGDFAVNGLGYDVVGECEPTKTRIYDCEGASVVTFSGHGFPHKIKFSVDGKEETKYKCGIIIGEDQKDGGYNYAGIDDMYLDACRLAVLSSCQTAAEPKEGYNYNIAEYMVEDANVKSSIGWRVNVYSPDMTEWLTEFYKKLAEGFTVSNAQSYVDNMFAKKWDETVYTSVIYGDKDTTVTLPITDTKAQNVNITDIFTYIDEDLHINKATKDFHEVENYLAKKVPGFNLEDFVLDEYQLMDRNGMYYLNYNYVVSGYETPYYVMVYCENDIPVKYYVKLPSDEQKQAMKPVQVLNMDDKIAEAKEKAVENIFENKYLDNLTVESQEVTSKMDENGNTYLYVSTTYTFTDDDDVITGVDKYQYVLQCNL